MIKFLAVRSDWVHHQYEEKSAFSKTYGISGNQGAVNLGGIRHAKEVLGYKKVGLVGWSGVKVNEARLSALFNMGSAVAGYLSLLEAA